MARIGTHSGKFHADEVFAVMMLRSFVPEFADAQVVRTRDACALQALTAVVDVGGVFDAQTLRFDHHQSTFSETFSPRFSTRLSSCGLVYRHFAATILPRALARALSAGTILAEQPRLSAQFFEEFAVSFYEHFVEHIDAVDNGVALYAADARPRYSCPWTDIFARVNRLNGAWWEAPTLGADERFGQAMLVAEDQFLHSLADFYFGSYHVLAAVRAAVQAAAGQVVCLPLACRWKDALFKAEGELDCAGRVKFVVFKDEGCNSFRVQAVPAAPDSFELRVPLLQQWRGLRGAELAAVSGVADAVFCHANGFIGGADTLESCVRMAELSLPKE